MSASGGDGPGCLPGLRRGESEFAVDVAARLGSHVKQAEQALMVAKSEALRPFDLSVAQYAVLVALYYVPGQSSAQLARAGAVTPQTMAAVLTRLVDKGLVERVPSRWHSKVLVTSLTSAGEVVVSAADVQARAVEDRLARAFTSAERAQLQSLLARAGAVLRAQTGGSSPQVSEISSESRTAREGCPGGLDGHR